MQEKKNLAGEKPTLKKSGSSVTIASIAVNDFNIERNQALKNIIKEKEKEISLYHAALTELKNEFERLKKRLFDYE